MMILLNKGRLAITTSRYKHAWAGLTCSWDYYSIITVINIATFELIVEFVHYGIFKRRPNRNSIGFELVNVLNYGWRHRWRLLEIHWPRFPLFKITINKPNQ
jgi:hypothetical protein